MTSEKLQALMLRGMISEMSTDDRAVVEATMVKLKEIVSQTGDLAWFAISVFVAEMVADNS